MGIPPLIGFFGKQMVLSAALDKGYIFITLIAILTSVIGGVYYLTIIKEIFFYSPTYKVNPILEDLTIAGKIEPRLQEININYKNITLSSPMAFIISAITLIILLFIFLNKE
jgi:NADH-ubiquinone oxidoreductase chain 2